MCRYTQMRNAGARLSDEIPKFCHNIQVLAVRAVVGANAKTIAFKVFMLMC